MLRQVTEVCCPLGVKLGALNPHLVSRISGSCLGELLGHFWKFGGMPRVKTSHHIDHVAMAAALEQTAGNHTAISALAMNRNRVRPIHCRGQNASLKFRNFCTELLRSGKKYPENFPNLLASLWLKDTPCAYSFCNLDLHPIASYSKRTRFFGFRPPACIE